METIIAQLHENISAEIDIVKALEGMPKMPWVREDIRIHWTELS